MNFLLNMDLKGVSIYKKTLTSKDNILADICDK